MLFKAKSALNMWESVRKRAANEEDRIESCGWKVAGEKLIG